MAISAKSRSRQVLIGEPDADGSLNDNHMHPGHELSDLRNVQRQPAGEAVVHYARFAQIPSFPDHPEAEPTASVPAPPMDAAVEKQGDEKKPVRRRVALTCVGSFFFHAGLVVALTLLVPKPPNEVIEDAGEAVSVVVFGDFDVDQTSAGDPELEVKPEEIAAEEVKPDTVQSMQPEQAQPVEAESVEAVSPSQEVTRVSPETVVAAEPEILVSQNPAETFVAQPMATAVPEQPVPDIIPTTVPEQAAAVQPTEVQPEEVKPVEAAEVSPEPEERPEPQPKSKIEKPKPDEKKQPRKKVEPTGGKNGTDRKDTTRGVATGQDAPEFNGMATTAGRGDGIGSAAVANYPGKVQKRIRRAIRVPNEYKRMGEAISVRVRLTIDGTGRLSSVSVAGSSGIPDLDKAALDGVRRAAPFPPLPPQWGKASWSFTQEVQVTSR
ncbi:TonB family protein [Rhizobium leguminosarum]|uniref:TonB family protein n=1 Tax=Rhizobium leguminosarum TaxID=384 RepID=A0AAJ1A869_RHILE|nr:TonB family protein [Rhizobium leguminosarum]MBY5535119.1 TonB family protein [Rhizobium leguminosarum]MBY5597096.1 TonB family protein [Rhizobium leguminosarum]MBY5615561.1 TonB family protein [Rhizobium leguminosarum]MBY5629115.1 TonB family protein [Rhizobium leguminosarum]MBY5732286.1 TonB family protein [Rhizobium leguminosarum]